MTFLSRIWARKLVAKGKITEKQARQIMLEFIDRAIKLEEEKGIRIYEIVNEENLKDYLKDNEMK